MIKLWRIVVIALCWCGADAKVEPYDAHNFFHFVTRPDIGAPRWNLQVYDRDALQPDMYWFVSPYAHLEQVDYYPWNGPHIYDMNGGLIWSGAPMVSNINAFDFRVSHVDGGQPMLSFIWPSNEEGNGWILDNTYTKYKVVDMIGEQPKWNMHDFNLVDDGKRALMLYHPTFDPTPLTIPGEFDGPCNIGWQGFKEVDVNTNEILFKWNSQGHIDLNETNYVPSRTGNTLAEKCDSEWDITHFNAIDKFDNGDYLLSARHTDTIYKISHRDGSIIWRLGGPKNDFVMKDERTKFTRQHHARLRGHNETHTLISLFDNATGSGSLEEKSAQESWGLYLALRTDVQPMEVSLISRYQKPVVEHEFDETPLTKARGSMSFLPNGNVFMGWSVDSEISEHAPDGRLLMKSIMMQGGADSYRSYKMPWKGYPAEAPKLVARVIERGENLTTTAYVSWNGATEVSAWVLLHTNRYGNVTEMVASSRRNGFETRLDFDGYARYVIAVAIDAAGKELGRSGVTLARLPNNLYDLPTAMGELNWMNSHSEAWSASSPEDDTSSLSGLEWVLVGLSSCIFVCFVGFGIFLRCNGLEIGVSLRRKTSWMSILRRYDYESLALINGDEPDERQWEEDRRERKTYADEEDFSDTTAFVPIDSV